MCIVYMRVTLKTLRAFCCIKKGIQTSFSTNSLGEFLYNVIEKSDAMYIEVYIDSLLLINFVMNLYVLLLVNRITYRSASRIRMIWSALAGTVAYLIPFLGNSYSGWKLFLSVTVGSTLMIVIAFRVRSISAFVLILERLLLVSFLMGGGIVFLIKYIPGFGLYTSGILSVMGGGAVIFMITAWILKKNRGKNHLCQVTLLGCDGKIKVTALVDSGNSLVEPISGKPVSIVESGVFHGLWKEVPQQYRVIPYHSIGKKKGILKGYLLPEIEIEKDGAVKCCREVYVAVSEESISGDKLSLRELTRNRSSGIRMIVNPALLECN